MHIKVEQKHIDKAFDIFKQKGIYGLASKTNKYDNMSCSENCPIALAIKDMGYKYVYVHRFNAIFSNNSVNHTSVKLPISATLFVDKFDNDGKVEPFEFDTVEAF